jgi:peptide/nickel transport system substrate-binding protein
MVGTGPFILDSWERDNYVKFKKNPNYWQPGKPYLDYLQLKNVTDLTVSIMAFKAGEAQALENPDPVDAKQMGQEGYTIHQPALYFYHAWVTDGNNPNSPFANKLVRQALEYAVDRKTMSAGIGMGYYEPLYQAATKNALWYDASLAPREYNPDKAKQLLAEAGYPNGFTTKIVSDVRVRKDTLVAVQTYLKAVGIKADLDIADVARASTLTMKGWEGILFPGFPTAGTFVGLLGRYGVSNDYVSYYRPAGWQDKWDAMVAETNDAKRMDMFKAIVKIIYDEANVSFYQGDAPLMALRPNTVNGFELHCSLAADYFTPETIWLSK